MANFDFLEEFAVSVGEAEKPQSVYEKFILTVGNQVTSDLREYIQQNAMNTGALAQSVVYFPTGALSFEIQADDYYKFVDQGVTESLKTKVARFHSRHRLYLITWRRQFRNGKVLTCHMLLQSPQISNTVD